MLGSAESFGGPEGVLALAVAVVSWSLAPSLVSRAASRTRIDPLGFNGWRMLVAAVATLPLAVILEGFPANVPWLDPWFEAGVWLGGVVGSIVGDGLFVASVARVGAAVALPVSYLFMLWSGLADYFTGRVGPTVPLGAAIALAGVALVAGRSSRPEAGEGHRDLLGTLEAVGASLVWAGSMYAYQAALSRAGPLSVAEARAVFMALVLLPWMLRWTRGLRIALAETVASSLLGYVVGSIAFLVALRLMPASLVSVGLAANPVLTQATAALVAGERLSSRLAAGALLVALGIAVATVKP